jgi:hypothetical protein
LFKWWNANLLEGESEAQIPMKRAVVVDQCIWNKWAERFDAMQQTRAK